MSEETKGIILVKVALVSEDGTDEKWTISPESFAADTHPLPVTGNVTVEGRLYKADNTIYFNGEVEAVMGLECSRCLKSFNLPVKDTVAAVFMPKEEFSAAGEEQELSGEDMDITVYDGEQIELYGPVRDQLALAAPMRPLCSEDCKGLCPVCGADLNVEKCGCQAQVLDPRLAALKKLIK
ncbi:MAG: DUF177 domain-containing protein [Nitrospinae bacterium]|nr:DUF177 domain-containing protein [Nitrospinota bacterium]